MINDAEKTNEVVVRMTSLHFLMRHSRKRKNDQNFWLAKRRYLGPQIKHREKTLDLVSLKQARAFSKSVSNGMLSPYLKMQPILTHLYSLYPRLYLVMIPCLSLTSGSSQVTSKLVEVSPVIRTFFGGPPGFSPSVTNC